MKISRNDLRRMILETLLREQASDVQGTGAGARKTKEKYDAKSDFIKAQIEETIKTTVSKTAGEESFNGVITVGRFRAEVTRANPEALGKAIERDLENNAYLKQLQKSLKVGRAFKITVNKAQNVEPDAKVEEEKPAETKEVPDEYGPMGNEDLYIYRVNKATGCWETKKKESQGAWISLKNNAKATNTLDNKYPEARSNEDKARCNPSASKKGASAQGSRGTNSLTDVVNTAIDGGILSVTTTNQVPALNSETGINVAFNVSELNLLGEDLGLNNLPSQPGYLIIKKQKSGKGGPDNLIVGAAVLQVKENGTDVLYLGPNKETKGSQTLEQIKLNDFEGAESTWGANLIAPGMLQKIVNYLNSNVNESYGKSHATLIRERYWGRY